MSLVRAASTSRIAFNGEIGSIVTAIARTICACKSSGERKAAPTSIRGQLAIQ